MPMLRSHRYIRKTSLLIKSGEARSPNLFSSPILEMEGMQLHKIPVATFKPVKHNSRIKTLFTQIEIGLELKRN